MFLNKFHFAAVVLFIENILPIDRYGLVCETVLLVWNRYRDLLHPTSQLDDLRLGKWQHGKRYSFEFILFDFIYAFNTILLIKIINRDANNVSWSICILDVLFCWEMVAE